MKKNLVWLIVAVVVVVVIVLVGRGGGDNGPAAGNGEDKTQKEEKLVAAFDGFGSVKCEYNDAKTGTASTILVKDGKARITTEVDKAIANIIYRDEKVYVWSNTAPTQGFVYTSEELEKSPSSVGVFSKTRFEDQLKQQDVACEEATIADSEFSLPSDVNFQSVGDLLKAQ